MLTPFPHIWTPRKTLWLPGMPLANLLGRLGVCGEFCCATEECAQCGGTPEDYEVEVVITGFGDCGLSEDAVVCTWEGTSPWGATGESCTWSWQDFPIDVSCTLDYDWNTNEGRVRVTLYIAPCDTVGWYMSVYWMNTKSGQYGCNSISSLSVSGPQDPPLPDDVCAEYGDTAKCAGGSATATMYEA